MSLSVENHLRNTKEEQRYNEQFEERIRTEVYRMHGISEDKLQGDDGVPQCVVSGHGVLPCFSCRSC